jgi:FKBP-type peptidyl-prolyl cis-trans isomerase 2
MMGIKIKWVLGVVVFLVLIILILSFLFLPKKKETNLNTKYYIAYSIYVDNSIYEQKNISFFGNDFSRILGINKEIELSNRSIGETFNITLSASEAYGEYKQELVKVIRRKINDSRYRELPYFVNVSREDFVKNYGEPIINFTIGGLFPVKVVAVDDVVTLKLDVKVGDTSKKDDLGFWFEVANIDEEKNVVKLKLNCDQKQIPSENGIINLSFDDQNIYLELTPIINKTIEWDNQKGKVKEYNQTHIILDDNPPLAGKSIVIEIKILNITKEFFTGYCAKHENAPSFDVFIMSYCPYGLQFVKGLLPVWKEFNDKANINVRFVSYTMHGQKEAEENARMICIREEQCEKYMAYLECFVETGNSQGCISKVGIDKEKLERCINSKAKEYLAYDAMLNEKYGVRGSPTVVINGKVVEIWPRSPANIAKILCQYFDKKPEECSKKFSEANPSPGFGSGFGNGGGSCG